MRRILNEKENDYVTNKRMLFHFTVCFPHRIKPGCLIRLLRIHFLKLLFFLFLSFSEPPYQSLFYFTYPLTVHWMTAVVLLLIQGMKNNTKMLIHGGKHCTFSCLSLHQLDPDPPTLCPRP